MKGSVVQTWRWRLLQNAASHRVMRRRVSQERIQCVSIAEVTEQRESTERRIIREPRRVGHQNICPKTGHSDTLRLQSFETETLSCDGDRLAVRGASILLASSPRRSRSGARDHRRTELENHL